MAVLNASNEAIINTVRANASLEYQTRIPATTKANLAATLAMIKNKSLFSFFGGAATFSRASSSVLCNLAAFSCSFPRGSSNVKNKNFTFMRKASL